MAQRKRPEDLRSHQWFGTKDLRSFGHRSRALQMGYTREDFSGKLRLDDARDRVGAAARRERHDPADGSRRILLRVGRGNS